MLVKGSLEYVAIINPKRRSKYYFNKIVAVKSISNSSNQLSW